MPETARSVIILGTAGRSYPAALCGTLYPDGIPVFPETDLARLSLQRFKAYPMGLGALLAQAFSLVRLVLVIIAVEERRL